jgi:hypothetical protein
VKLIKPRKTFKQPKIHMQTKNQIKTSNTNTIYLYFSENQRNKQIQSVVTLINKSYEDDQIKKKYFLHQSSVKEKKHKIKTKLENEQSFRLTFVERENMNFKYLMEKLSSIYPKSFVLVYQDDEGDFVSIYVEEEFQIALLHFGQSKKNLKFTIKTSNHKHCL